MKAPADTSGNTPADTVPGVSDSTGTGDSTTAIRGNARGFAGQDAQARKNTQVYDVQGRHRALTNRKARARNAQNPYPTVKKVAK